MTNREIENKIKKAFTSATPDVFERVLCECNDKAKVIQVTKKRNFNIISIRKIISVAAAIAIVITAGAVGFLTRADRVDSVICLDVNPSIELDINKKEKIVEAQALNEDAEKVLDGMDLKGSDISVAVNAVIGSMLRNGFIDELANSILISVDNKNEEKSEELKERLSKVVEDLLKTDDFEGAVISQTIKKEDKTAELAEKYGITKGKAQLIQQIIKADSRYKFGELASLNINELNLILSGKKTEGTVASSGTASEKQYIGKDKAKQIALKQANVAESDVTDYECELDYTDGVMVYEIEFETKTQKYEYDIDAKSGEIIKSEIGQGAQDTQDIPQENINYVSEDRAKEIALTRADVNEDSITEYECERKDAKYEIEFSAGELKYSYKIDALTGDILDEKRESADKNSQGNDPKKYVGKLTAKNIALAYVKLAVKDIKNFKCELDTDGDLAVYELEFCDKSGNKHSFEISAEKGQVIDYSKRVVEKTDKDDGDNVESEENGVTYIGIKKAREIALKNVGVANSSVKKFKCELEKGENPAVYEVEFLYKDIEYSFEIDATTGKILNVEKEIINDQDEIEDLEDDDDQGENNAQDDDDDQGEDDNSQGEDNNDQGEDED